MSGEDDSFDTWLKTFEGMSSKSAEETTSETLRALIHLTRLLAEQRSPEEYRHAMELIYLGRVQLRFTVHIPPAPIAITGDMLSPNGEVMARLLEVRGMSVPQTTH